jgi:hypothetical protein
MIIVGEIAIVFTTAIVELRQQPANKYRKY